MHPHTTPQSRCGWVGRENRKQSTQKLLVEREALEILSEICQPYKNAFIQPPANFGSSLQKITFFGNLKEQAKDYFR